MKKVILMGIVLLLFGLMVMGCTAPPPETTVQPSLKQPSAQTEQQILEEYPDNLDQALEELDVIE